MNEDQLFAVVEFPDSNEVEAVPDLWLYENGRMCYWPPFKSTKKVTDAIKSMTAFEPNWLRYKSKVLQKYGQNMLD